jgi:hypothetical protein
MMSEPCGSALERLTFVPVIRYVAMRPVKMFGILMDSHPDCKMIRDCRMQAS